MGLSKLIILAILPIVALSISPISLAADTQYDYYVLAMELPGTVCLFHHCDKADTGLLTPTTVNLHGLWPNRNDGHHPFTCTNEPFDPKTL
jgi:ribonuclease I